MTQEEQTDNSPLDIKKPWLSVARRLQSISMTKGWALISITILVDEEGCPKMWLSPTCKKIEPKLSASGILKMLTDELEKEGVVLDS